MYALDTPGIATGVEPIGPKDNLITDVLGLTGELKEQHYGGWGTYYATARHLWPELLYSHRLGYVTALCLASQMPRRHAVHACRYITLNGTTKKLFYYLATSRYVRILSGWLLANQMRQAGTGRDEFTPFLTIV